MKTNRPALLLDSNVLIALTDTRHVSHARVQQWMEADTRAFATCPITQGALVRFFVRRDSSHGLRIAKSLVEGLQRHPRHQFWPDDVPYTMLPERGLRGHKQVTDYYLVALVQEHAGRLLTLDRALAMTHREWCVLLPA